MSAAVTMATATASDFIFPQIHSFPPFYTIQPNSLTRASQFRSWSSLIQAYCRRHHIFKLTLVDALNSGLFNNTTIRKRLSEKDAKEVIDHMVSKDGDERAEWVGPQKAAAWIWWRKPEEWAALLEHWVSDTGQKGTVLTLYELVEGEATEKQDFHGLDTEILHKSLATLVKSGKAQVFGSGDQQGVKFF